MNIVLVSHVSCHVAICDVSLLLPITGYGMTEMLATHMQPREDTKPGSVGVLMANLECKVKIFYVSI